MAVDMFLKIEGVEGEARDKDHENEIDVLSWNWGMTQSGSMHLGGGGGAGKVNVQDLSVTKWIDKSSANCQRYCAKGKHFGEALLTVRKAGDHPLEYVKITMHKVMVTSVQTGGSGGEDRLTENVILNFEKVKFEYTEQKQDGSKGKTFEFGWDIPRHEEF